MTIRLARLLAALALTVAAAGCSEEDAQDAVDRAAGQASSAIENADVPDVDWGNYPGELRDRLEKLTQDADCDGLQQELAEAEGNDTELTRYIKAQLRKANC